MASQCLKCHNEKCYNAGKNNIHMDGKKNTCISFQSEYDKDLKDEQEVIVKSLQDIGFFQVPLFIYQQGRTITMIKIINKYLMPAGHLFYSRAVVAETMEKCLYWLQRYYDENYKLVKKEARLRVKEQNKWVRLQQPRGKHIKKGTK